MHKLDPESEEDTRQFIYLYSFVYERQMSRAKRGVELWRDLMQTEDLAERLGVSYDRLFCA